MIFEISNSHAFQNVRNFIEQGIKEHEESFNPNELRDYIDVYLAEMRESKDPESSFHGEAGKENLVQSLIDLFFAGSETTSSTLSWATLFLIRHPDIQVCT